MEWEEAYRKWIEKVSEELAKLVNTRMKEWNMPLRLLKIPQRKVCRWEEKLAQWETKEGRKKGQYKYLTTDLTWEVMKKWNRGKLKKRWVKGVGRWEYSPVYSPREKIIYGFVGKKLVRWNRCMRKLYKIRAEIKKVETEKKNLWKQIKEVIETAEGEIGEIKVCVWQDGKFVWVEKEQVEKVGWKQMEEIVSRIKKKLREKVNKQLKGEKVKLGKEGWKVEGRPQEVKNLTARRIREWKIKVKPESSKYISRINRILKKVRRVEREIKKQRKAEEEVKNKVREKIEGIREEIKMIDKMWVERK